MFYLRSHAASPSVHLASATGLCACLVFRRTAPGRAGVVILRQRPGTAKGVIFLTLEDETGTVNIVVWRHLYERHRRAVIAGRMLKVTGRIQRENSVIHILAEQMEDISPLLDTLLSDPEL